MDLGGENRTQADTLSDGSVSVVGAVTDSDYLGTDAFSSVFS